MHTIYFALKYDFSMISLIGGKVQIVVVDIEVLHQLITQSPLITEDVTIDRGTTVMSLYWTGNIDNSHSNN